MLKKAVLLFILILLSIYLASCQTVEGLGKDITWIGQSSAEVLEQ